MAVNGETTTPRAELGSDDMYASDGSIRGETAANGSKVVETAANGSILGETAANGSQVVETAANGSKVLETADNGSDVEEDNGVPIDRGWAWIVVIGCFGMHMLIVGGVKSFGVLFVEFQDKYQASAQELGIIQGMGMTFMLGLGLFSNMLAVRFTCRKVVFVGGILTSIGFIMTAYMPSFWNLYLTYAVTGVGFGLSYSPCVVMVGCHFRKRRSLANGISVSGSGVGSFVLPNIMRVLLDTYDLSGCLLILGAITLNVCACAMLFRPLSSYRPKVKRTKVTGGEKSNTEEGRVPTVKCEEDQDNTHREDSTDKDMRHDGMEMEKLLNNNSGNWELYENDKNLALSGNRNLIYKGETNLRKPGMHLLAPDMTSGRLTPSQYASNGDIFMASLQNIPRGDMADLNNRCLDLGCLSRPGGSEKKTKVKTSNKAKVKDPNKPKLFNWSLVTNPVFLMYASSCVLANFGYPNIFFMLPAFAESNGQDRNSAALLVSIIGITDLLGRFCLGWFSDFNFIPKRFGFIGCIAISSVLNIIVPAMTSFAAMATYAALYGFFGGAFWALIAVLLAEALGVEKLSSSYGLITISMATSLLPGPIICGLIRDATLSWNYAFIFCGIMALIGSVIPIFEPCAQKYLAAKEEKKALSKV